MTLIMAKQRSKNWEKETTLLEFENFPVINYFPVSEYVQTYIKLVFVLRAKSPMEIMKVPKYISRFPFQKSTILCFKDYGLFGFVLRQWCKKRLGHYGYCRVFAYATNCIETIYSMKELANLDTNWIKTEIKIGLVGQIRSKLSVNHSPLFKDQTRS